MTIKNKIKKSISNLLFKQPVVKTIEKKNLNYSDVTHEEKEIIDFVSKYTMTSTERIVSLIRSIKFVEDNNIEGDIVECGVWKGGSMMAVLKILVNLRSFERKIYLYDTFEGMTEPSNSDMSFKGESALKAYKEKNEYWDRIECVSNLEEVKLNIQSIKYPKDKINYVKGKVEDTIPKTIPEKIAVLRLDTDWYKSTLHEMEHLYPKLVKGGIVIIDDYGHWEGCRKAVDEYIRKNNIKLFLSRVDYTCRIGVKYN